ncbi:MAG: DUF177 domain-containing protein [Candidatus Mcinerneyibacterium aminivorans]|uniref:DUF177 domain-containing protein n=1 Tax=Candidatus Mcinerneyibacterium aminivorans TaxID=2703815 RepID=A0A5D0ML40_9BACT|nr:MAG: DUF177 domain-containing protein [Candidatus Mcinerneyibacterium aminivorans]
MKIDLRKAKSERLFIKEDLELDIPEVTDPVSVDLKVYESNQIFVLRGKMDVTYSLNCSRCLTRFEREETLDLFLVFKYENTRNKNVKEKEIDEDEINVIFIEQSVIDITEYIINEIMLNIPIKVLCKEDCKGLCPICGTDLNEGSCDCKKEKVDERMKQLEDIKKRMFDKKE